MLGIFAVDTSAMVFGMPSALFPAFALHRLGGDASTVGYLYAAPYAGALVGSLFSGWTSHVRRQGLGVTVAACAWGAAIAGFGFMTALWPALVLLAVAGGADFYSAVLRSTILMRVDARPPARPPARDRVRAGRERAEPRRPRGGRARVAHVAALLDRLRRCPLHRRLHRRRRSRCQASSAMTHVSR